MSIYRPLLFLWVDAAIAGALSLASGIFRPSLKKQYKYQKKYLDDQTAASKELYDYQFRNESEYNDPSNYLKRLMDGADANGLSKSAVLDGGAAGQSGVQHQGMPSSGSGTSYDFAASDLGSKLMQNSLIGAQIRNLDSQSNKNNKEAGAGGTMDADINLKNSLAEQAANNSDLLREKALSEPIRRGLDSVNAALMQLQVDNYQSITDANIKKILSEAEKAWNESVLKGKESNFYDRLAKQQIAESNAKIVYNLAASKAQKALTAKYGAEAFGQKLQNGFMSQSFQDRLKQIVNDAKYAKLKPYLEYLDTNTKPIGFIRLTSPSESMVNSLSEVFEKLLE